MDMKRKGYGFTRLLFSGTVAALGISSCVYIDESLGENFIPTDQMYDIYMYEFPLRDIKTEYCDSLSGFSSSRITVGAVRDAENGLSTRTSSFTLIPVYEEMDFGTDRRTRTKATPASSRTSMSMKSRRTSGQNTSMQVPATGCRKTESSGMKS